MEEENPQINGMVYQYLSTVSAKVAKLFKKECKTEMVDPVPGSPSLSDCVKSFSAGEKRKLNGSINGTPAKKAKMNGKAKKDSDSEDSSEDSDSEEEAPKKAAVNGKGNLSFWM